MTCLDQCRLSINDIQSINSIDIKADEVGLIELSEALEKPYHTFDKTTLAQVEPLLSVKSDYVFKTVGVYGVAESAALVAVKLQASQSNQLPELVLNKVKTA